MKAKKEHRGGKRPGAGRPPSGNAKEWVTISISKETKAKLKKLKKEKNISTYNSLILALLRDL